MALSTSIRIVVVCGKSGSGKSTLIRYLMEQCPDVFRYVPSVTTGPIRRQDFSGEYISMRPKKFKKWVRRGHIHWPQLVHGHWRGTLRASYEQAVISDHLWLKVLSPHSMGGVVELFPNQVALFYIPSPGDEELERRLLATGRNTPHEIKARLAECADWDAVAATQPCVFLAPGVSTAEMAEEILARLGLH